MRTRTSLIVSASVALAAAAAVVAVRRTVPAPASPGPGKLTVVATLFPLYDMAKSIGGDKAEVALLLPPGMEPHSFEPKPGDIARIDRADIFVYTGAFMEPWADDIIRGSSNAGLLVVDSGKGIEPERDADHGSAPDPHIWLDLGNAKIMAGAIAAAFEKKDPANRAYYRGTAAEYGKKLAAMDEAFKAGLAVCRTRTVVYGGHYAFAYLARRYGLAYFAAQGLSPDAEPTARDLAALVEQIKRDKISAVFYEELTNPKIAETVAGETGAEMIMLSAAHNVSRDQLLGGVTFFDILRKDLTGLRRGLECR